MPFTLSCMKTAFFGKGSLCIVIDLGLSVLGWRLLARRATLVCGLESKPLVVIERETHLRQIRRGI